MSTLKIEILFDQDFLSFFKKSVVDLIQRHSSEGRFQNIKSFKDKKHVKSYINKISKQMESTLTIPSMGYAVEVNSMQYAEEIFHKNTANFTKKIFNKWENYFIRKVLQKSFTNNISEYETELNKILKKELLTKKEDAEYFLEINKVSWLDTIGKFDNNSTLSFSIEHVFNFKGINLLTGDKIEDIDEDKNVNIKKLKEVFLADANEISKNYFIKDLPFHNMSKSRHKAFHEIIYTRNISPFISSLNALLSGEFNN